MDFPDWVPKCLASTCDPSNPKYSLRMRLLTKPGMEKVWKLIEKHPHKELDPKENLFSFLAMVEAVAKYSARPYFMTRSDAIDKTEELVKLAQRLEEKFKKAPFPDFEVYIETSSPMDAQNHSPILYVSSEANVYGLSMARLLNVIASSFDNQVLKLKSNKEIFPSTRKLYFIRAMGRVFKKRFGKHHYEHLAILAKAALDDDEGIGKDTVRDALRKKNPRRGVGNSP